MAKGKKVSFPEFRKWLEARYEQHVKTAGNTGIRRIGANRSRRSLVTGARLNAPRVFPPSAIFCSRLLPASGHEMASCVSESASRPVVLGLSFDVDGSSFFTRFHFKAAGFLAVTPSPYTVRSQSFTGYLYPSAGDDRKEIPLYLFSLVNSWSRKVEKCRN